MHLNRALAAIRQTFTPPAPEAVRSPLARATGQARRPDRRVHARTLPGLPRPTPPASAPR